MSEEREQYKPRVGDLLRNRETGEVILVGHVNESGGVCDDCFTAPWDQWGRGEHGSGLEDGWEWVQNFLGPESKS
jgi:hypothetical protein